MTPAKLAQAGAARAPVSPTAWLDKMAADVGHAHLQRLAELRVELQGQAAARDGAALAAALAQLDQALPRLDFSLLQPRGWWARTTGKSRSAGAEFAAQYQQAEQGAAAVATQVQALHKQQQAQAGSTDRMLVEFEVEYRALDKIIDQGARWLQDMRNQIKSRQAQPADAQAEQQTRDDAARCELLVARLKLLRSAAAAAQQAHQQAQSTAARRAALLQVLQQGLASGVKAWRVRLSPVAADAGEDKSSPPRLDKALEAHQELRVAVQQAGADASQLDVHEKSLAQALAALDEQLSAAR